MESRRYCGERMSTSPASNIYGWTLATGARTRQGLGTEKTLGWSVDLVERLRSPAPKEVPMALPEQCRKEGVMVDWEKLLPPRGFVVLPRRWVVERSFAWMLRRPWTTNAPLV